MQLATAGDERKLLLRRQVTGPPKPKSYLGRYRTTEHFFASLPLSYHQLHTTHNIFYQICNPQISRSPVQPSLKTTVTTDDSVQYDVDAIGTGNILL